MRHRQKKIKLNLDYDHRRSLIKGQVRDLWMHGKVKTTISRSRLVVKLVERMISRVKRDKINGARFIFSQFQDRALVGRIVAAVEARFAAHKGGATRVRKIRHRLGDNAVEVAVEFVDGLKLEPEKKEVEKKKEAKLNKAEKKEK